MAKYEQYVEYRDSGVEWLGEIPHGWKVLRGKYVFQEFRERSTTGEEVLLSVSEYYGVKPRSEKISEGDHLSRAESLVDYKKCYKNDLVMNIMLAWKRGLGVSKYDGIVSPAYSVFRFNKDIHPYFMHHLFRTDLYTSHFKTRSTGVIDSRLRLYPESFLDTEILIPSYEEQAQITSFLDHETAQIDTLIEKQQTLIKLLKEKRQAVISHAVTKGLNPDAPMKDSGVEWLGEVPEHWTVIQLKHACDLLKDGTHLPPPRVDVGIPLLSVRNVVDGKFTFRDDDSQISERDYHQLSKSFTPQNGDVLLAIVGATLGKAAVVENMQNFHIQRSLAIFRTNQLKINNYFLNFLFNSQSFQSLLWENAGFSAQPGIYLGSLSNFLVPMPSLSEQIEITNFLNDKIHIFDNLIKKAELAIKLMKERRTALISAAVTGKIDVRDWQVPDNA